MEIEIRLRYLKLENRLEQNGKGMSILTEWSSYPMNFITYFVVRLGVDHEGEEVGRYVQMGDIDDFTNSTTLRLGK